MAQIKAAPDGDGAPDLNEILTLSRSVLMEGMVAELLDFFDWPRGRELSEFQARLIAAGGVRRAVAAYSTAKRCPSPT